MKKKVWDKLKKIELEIIKIDKETIALRKKKLIENNIWNHFAETLAKFPGECF